MQNKIFIEELKRGRQQMVNNPSVAVDTFSKLNEKFPNEPEVLLSLSESFANIGRHTEARAVAKKCLNMKMNVPLALSLSRHLTGLGMEQQAINLAKNTYLKSGEPLGLATKVLLTATHVCDWDLTKKITDKLLQFYKSKQWKSCVETPRTHLLWCDDESINNRVFQYFANQLYPKFKNLKPLPKKIENRKIKLVYMSSDYRDHPTAQLIKGLIKEHNRDKFEIIAYDSGFDDKSTMREEILGFFDRVVILKDINDEEAGELLKKEEIDVVIELNGLTNASRMGILSTHPVPLQIGYLGFPGSVGGRFMDYIIADSYVLPEKNEKYYSEKIIRIEKTYQANDHLNEDWPELVHRRSYGFSEEAFILGMFNNANKVTEEAWQVWMQIMSSIPRSVLWMLVPNQVAQNNLKNACIKYGIDPSRLIFAPRMSRSEHFQRMAICDVMLDPWPYGGHTTTSDALFAGIPVVTLQGNNFASRVSGGLVTASGLPGLVAENKEDYIQGVIRLSREPDLLERAKNHLKNNRLKMSIFNSKIKAEQLEAAITLILSNRIKGIPDKNINMNYGASSDIL